MKILVLKSPQIPTVEEFFYIGTDGDERDAYDELAKENFLPHGTIRGRFQTTRNGREWIVYFKEVGDTAIHWHLLNTPPVGGLSSCNPGTFIDELPRD